MNNLLQKTDEELLKEIFGLDRAHPTAVAVEHILNFRSAQRQVEASNALVKATGQLVTVTNRLGLYTLLLVLATILQFGWTVYTAIHN